MWIVSWYETATDKWLMHPSDTEAEAEEFAAECRRKGKPCEKPEMVPGQWTAQ